MTQLNEPQPESLLAEMNIQTHQVLPQFGQHFRKDPLVVGLETVQLGKTWDEEP